MRKVLLSIALLGTVLTMRSQTTFVSDFESMGLTAGQFYNNTTSGIGFQNGHAFFAPRWDTSFGGYWSDGWSGSAVYDSSTGGFANQYGCAAYKGYGNSNTFAVGNTNGHLTIRMTDSLIGKTVSGFYVCNSTWATKSMLNGDGFAKKFGDTTGTNCGCSQGSAPDWFKLTVKRYSGGTLQNDSVSVYLADYRFTNNTQDYILKTWIWISLASLGNTDSLAFFLHSSDNGLYGMNTPAFFCIDDLTLSNTVGIANYFSEEGVNVFPNPANEFAEIIYNTPSSVYVKMKVADVTGREMISQSTNSFVGENRFRIDASQFPGGVYYVTLNADGKMLTKKLIKQ